MYKKKDELYHWGILGQKWGIRRFQNSDGSLTLEGRRRYGDSDKKVHNQKSSNYKKIGVAIAATALASYGAYKLYQNGGISSFTNKGKTIIQQSDLSSIKVSDLDVNKAVKDWNRKQDILSNINRNVIDMTKSIKDDISKKGVAYTNTSEYAERMKRLAELKQLLDD